jgi:hypothetical protein
VSKRLGSPYRSGRVADWLKVKNPAAGTRLTCRPEKRAFKRLTAAPVRRPGVLLSSNQDDTTMRPIAGLLLAFALALVNAPANAQAGATPATLDNRESAHSSTASEPNGAAAQTPQSMMFAAR